MNKQYDNSNRGAFFFNKNKTNPKAPDYSGKVELAADTLAHIMAQQQLGLPMELEINGWRKESARGTFLSLSVKVPWNADKIPAPKPAQGAVGFDDDIPF